MNGNPEAGDAPAPAVMPPPTGPHSQAGAHAIGLDSIEERPEIYLPTAFVGGFVVARILKRVFGASP